MRTTLLIAVVSICSFASPCVALTPATPMSNALQSETLNAQLEYCRSVADVVLDASPELAGWDVSSEMGKLLAVWAEVSSALSAAQSLQISAQFSSLINLRDQMKPLEAEYRVLYKPLGDLATHSHQLAEDGLAALKRVPPDVTSAKKYLELCNIDTNAIVPLMSVVLTKALELDLLYEQFDLLYRMLRDYLRSFATTPVQPAPSGTGFRGARG